MACPPPSRQVTSGTSAVGTSTATLNGGLGSLGTASTVTVEPKTEESLAETLNCREPPAGSVIDVTGAPFTTRSSVTSAAERFTTVTRTVPTGALAAVAGDAAAGADAGAAGPEGGVGGDGPP